jgi:hypothetical protein
LEVRACAARPHLQYSGFHHGKTQRTHKHEEIDSYNTYRNDI